MPVCELCDGENFYDIDGLFYCSSCDTQSQDVQVELKQEVDTTTFSADTANLTLKKTERKKRRARHYDIGKAWTIYEGQQYLIKAQVEALMAMGYNKKLKDCVRYLWFHYLRTIKVAFCEGEPETITLLQHSGRQKNEGKLPSHVRKKRHLDDDDNDHDHDAEDNMTLKKEECGDDLMEKDDLDKLKINLDTEMPDRDGQSVGDSSDEKKCESVGSFEVEGIKSVRKTISFKQCYSILFCYIGLVMLEEPVLLSDLIRWCHEGLIPYHKANQVLPSEMKFASDDFSVLCRRAKLCLSHSLARHFSTLCNALKIKPEASKKNLKIFAASVVVDLGFSKSVLALVCYLIDLDFERRRQLNKKVQLWLIADFKVSAIIIISLKLIYYLDDHHEMKNVIRESLLKTLQLSPVESWKSWVTRTMVKRLKKLHHGIPRDEKDIKYIRDLSVYKDYCTKDVFKEFDPRVTSSCYRRDEGTWRTAAGIEGPKAQYLEQIYPVSQILNPLILSKEINRVPTSFPLSVDHVGGVIHEDKLSTLNSTECRCKTDSQCLYYSTSKDKDVKLECSNLQNVHTSSVVDINECKTNLEVMQPKTKCEKYSDDVCSSALCDEKVDCASKYHYYSKEQSEHAWTDSYRYLIGVVSSRMETIPRLLQGYIHRQEKLLFGGTMDLE